MAKSVKAKVELINYTQHAGELIAFTKNTRLKRGLSGDLYRDIIDRKGEFTEEWLMKELDYASQTIPSSWAFVNYTFMVTGVSRAYTHQQVRTSIGAQYAQQTMRVLEQSDFEYVYTREDDAYLESTNHALKVVQEMYDKMINDGVPAEDARGILPTNIGTAIVCQFSLITLAKIAQSRTGGRTQKEYQIVANQMVDEVIKVHPWVEKFLYSNHERNYFDEIEAWAAKTFPNDLLKKGELLKIVDKMKKKGG